MRKLKKEKKGISSMQLALFAIIDPSFFLSKRSFKTHAYTDQQKRVAISLYSK